MATEYEFTTAELLDMEYAMAAYLDHGTDGNEDDEAIATMKNTHGKLQGVIARRIKEAENG